MTFLIKVSKLTSGLITAAFLASGAQAQQTLTAETTSPGNTPHTMMSTLAEVAAANGIANLQVADGQTLTNSFKNVAEGRTDIAAAPFIMGFLMSKGAGPYGKLGAEKGKELVANVRILYPYNFAGHTLYAYDSSPVKGWGDLAGQKVLNGPPRGGALNTARNVIKLVTGLDDGEGYEGIQFNWGQMPQAIADNSADAMVLTTSFPDARVTRALAAGTVSMWGIPKDVWDGDAMQKYLKSPGTAPMVLNASDIPAQEGLTVNADADGKFRMAVTVGGDVVHKDMDFDTAKALTAAAIASFDAIQTNFPYMKTAGLGLTSAEDTGVCGPNPLKYHPGAVAAWEEAGYTLPDCAKP